MTDVGDPLVCDVSHSSLPYGSRVVGTFQEFKDPGHFVGKGWMELAFERIILPPNRVIPVSAKVVEGPGYKVDKEGRILGKGHATRDTIEWFIPILWPLDIINLPRRGPVPVIKAETRLTLKLMEDIQIPLDSSLAYAPEPETPPAKVGWTSGDATTDASGFAQRPETAELAMYRTGQPEIVPGPSYVTSEPSQFHFKLFAAVGSQPRREHLGYRNQGVPTSAMRRAAAAPRTNATHTTAARSDSGGNGGGGRKRWGPTPVLKPRIGLRNGRLISVDLRFGRRRFAHTAGGGVCIFGLRTDPLIEITGALSRAGKRWSGHPGCLREGHAALRGAGMSTEFPHPARHAAFIKKEVTLAVEQVLSVVGRIRTAGSTVTANHELRKTAHAYVFDPTGANVGHQSLVFQIGGDQDVAVVDPGIR